MKAFLLQHKIKIIIAAPFVVLLLGMLIPANTVIPVKDATWHDWNHQTFWDNRWGRSGVHKGIDIFANVNRPVVSASPGIVIFRGERLLGGNTVAILGPKWRMHYYAHMNDIKVGWLSFVSQKEVIGTVGRTGNARNKPAHLHYSILSLVPYPWRWDDSMQGWKKAFFLDPTYQLLPKHRIKMARSKSKKKTVEKKLAENVY
ncbi:MAG: M23 family metallopeptidase [Gammaproteobacteria bacterium]|nr:M23 family metallopeptidase [Gammaproteobacteria bacterium]